MQKVELAIGAAVVMALSLGGAPIPVTAAVTPGNITCAQFMKMSPSARSAAFRSVASQMPMASLSTPVNQTSGQGASNQNRTARPHSTAQLIAACQAASPNATVRGAWSASHGATSTAGGK